MADEKCLIAYFSRKGNTEVIAKMIKELTGGDLFHISTKKPYPEDYHDTTVKAKQELRSNARPELSDHVADMDSYNLVYLGYPNWWGTAPMAIRTFLESYDFSGKKIIPFCTHGGGGLGKSIRDIIKLCPKADVVNAIAIYGSDVNNSKNKIEKWIQRKP